MIHRSLQGPSRVRVLVNGLHAKTGGGVTYLRSLLPYLAEDPGLELHLFLHRDQFLSFPGLEQHVRIHLFHFRQSLARLLLWEQLVLPILARLMGANVIFSPANYGPLFARGAVIMLRNSLAVVRGEARIFKRAYWGLLALATMLSIMTSRKTIAVSQYAALALTWGLPTQLRDKVYVIPHGVSPVFRPPSPERHRSDFFLIVADIYIQKNLHKMIEAADLLRAENPNLRIKIAGRIVDEDYYQELRRQMRHLDLESAIEFLGPLDTESLVELYGTCRLLIFPSTVETFGHPLLEAMACGAPVASSNTAAMPEVLGDAGLYFDPLDSADIAAVVGRLAKDAQLQAILSAKGLERARQHSLAVTAARTAAVLREAAVLAGRPI
jgi:glycosyltransferase involved in cell wall biosynthesis